jgi:hypothetical protein
LTIIPQHITLHPACQSNKTELSSMQFQEFFQFRLIKSYHRPVVDQDNRNPLLAGPAYHVPRRLGIPGYINFLEFYLMAL